MSDENPFAGIDLSAISGAIAGLQDIAAQGVAAIGDVEEAAAADVDPTHEIVIGVDLRADVEGHPYRVDATLRYEADVAAVLEAQGSAGQIGSLLDGLGIDLDDAETGAVIEQLGMPRAIGVLMDLDVRNHELHGPDGPISAAPETGSTMQITLDGEVLRMVFSRAFAYPELQAATMLFNATPSDAAMAEHVMVPTDGIGETHEFNWSEADKDGLTISGTVTVRELQGHRPLC